jgi:hypothetical protein
VTWTAIVGGVALVGVCAALAVDLGFGVAFVSDTVAVALTVYVAGLAAYFVGRRRDSSHWTQRGMLRVPLAAAAAPGLLALLRGPLLFPLPYLDTATTGHSPYFVLPLVSIVTPVVLEVVFRVESGAKTESRAAGIGTAPRHGVDSSR